MLVVFLSSVLSGLTLCAEVRADLFTNQAEARIKTESASASGAVAQDLRRDTSGFASNAVALELRRDTASALEARMKKAVRVSPYIRTNRKVP